MNWKIASENQLIQINARKFDGRVHRSWSAKLISQQNSLLLFVGVFENEVHHAELGVIGRGTISYEYYWLDRWYNVFRFHEPDGRLRNYYCNVNMPPTFDGSTLDYVDLDLDLLLFPGADLRILDEEEFLLNSRHFDYPPDVVIQARTALTELQSMIDNCDFPFDGSVAPDPTWK